jgi:hypothetical protein
MNMSGGGLGPAGCWITHKGLETWARMAKERSTHKTQVGAVRSLPFWVRHNSVIGKKVKLSLRHEDMGKWMHNSTVH